jgi:hypothetical protein
MNSGASPNLHNKSRLLLCLLACLLDRIQNRAPLLLTTRTGQAVRRGKYRTTRTDSERKTDACAVSGIKIRANCVRDFSEIAHSRPDARRLRKSFRSHVLRDE